ncbi:MAG: tetratricopeptide repeat protein [Deltaproteobacteria bacterium]|nr:tetratricopeptide repeat protein [Deltaproteobacteria bacterium]
MSKIAGLALGLLAIAVALPSLSFANSAKKGRDAAKSAATMRAKRAADEVRRGDVWLAVSDWGRAAASFRRATQLDAAAWHARVRLGFALARAGKVDEGLREIDAVIRATPGAIDAYLTRGDLLLEIRRWDAAEKSFEEAVRRDPKNGRAIFGMGDSARAAAGKLEGKAADRARERAKDFFELYLALSPRPARAREAEEAIHVLEHGEAGLLFLRGKNDLAAGRPADAVKSFSAALTKRAALDEARYLLGLALSAPAVGRREEARRAWRALAGHKDAHLQLGISYFEDGDLDEAERHLTRASVIDKKFAAAKYHLGLVFNERGDRDRAKAALRESLQLDPHGPTAKWASSRLQVWTGQIALLPEGQVIDAASEIDIGRMLAARLEARFGVVRDAAREERLSRVLKKLVQVSERRDSVRYSVRILNGDGLNAITVHGGRIYVFRGMLDFIDKHFGVGAKIVEDLYAGVLAHELTHVVMRHGIDRLKVAAASLASVTEGDARGVERLLLGFGRVQEFESDQYGALYCYRAGFDPSAVVKLFQNATAEGFEVSAASTHPRFSERAARLSDYLLDLRAKARRYEAGRVALRERRYAAAIAAFETFLGVFPDHSGARNDLAVALFQRADAARVRGIDGGERGGSVATVMRMASSVAPATRVRAIVLRGGDSGDGDATQLLREAESELERVTARDPGFFEAHVNLGAVLVALGDTERAKRVLEAALKRDSRSGAARLNLAVALSREGQWARAQTLTREALSDREHGVAALYNLALIEEARGRRDEARRIWEQYLAVDDESGWSRIARERVATLR